jgi:type IX secretion system PorP/SprF family membrane protein
MRKVLATIIASLMALWANAQDPQFSQFFFSPLLLGPSFAGTTMGTRAAANYRLQWPAISVPFQTTAVSVDHNFLKYNSGAGVLIHGDMAGSSLLNRTKAALHYTYNVEITSKFYFRPGIEFSFNRVGIYYNKLIFGDQMYYKLDHTNEDLSVKSRNYFDAGASALFFTEMYWGGASISHLMQPNESLTALEQTSKLPVKTTVYGGGKLKISGRMGQFDEESLFYAVMYRSQGKFDQLDLGAFWYKVPIMLGLWYRGIPGLKQNPDNSINQDAVVLLAGYRKESWAAAYSYDITISRLFLNSAGAHELSIGYYFNQDPHNRKRVKKMVVPCPRF